jgi:hypothetical protein
MTEHVTHIENLPDNRKVSVCSCGRWRSAPYKIRSDAEGKGLMHAYHGDEDNRVTTTLNFNSGTLAAELRWYRDQAENTLNTGKDREMWKMLADELEVRLQSSRTPTADDQPLW